MAQDDERLAYRGVFQNLFIRPEIGAVLGATAIWVFFWAVSIPFGTAGGAATILDVSTILGIMAVAVAMLMIGGEFDLSSGAATGALGIVTLLLVRDITGAAGGLGLHLVIALPLSFAIALGLGWINGTMVEKTGLPSFIVTLATFFVLRGMKLGFSKLVVDQIQVGRMDDLKGENKGYEFFQPIFGYEWQRNDHQLGIRDGLYIGFVVGGLALLVVALYELHFKHKATLNPAGLGMFLAGIVGSVVGILILHWTDSVGGNWISALVTLAAMLVGFVGLGTWRYEALPSRGSLTMPADALRSVGIGAVLIVAGVIAALVLDSTSEEGILPLTTEQGLRAILFVGLTGLGAVAMMVAAHQAGRSSRLSASAVIALNALVLVAIAFFIRSESESEKFRTSSFGVMLVVAGVALVWAVTSTMFAQRRAPDIHIEHLGKRLAATGLVIAVAGIVIRLLFTVDEEIAAGISPAKYSIRIVWFLGVTAVASWVLANTKFGSWVYAVGGNKQAARQVGVPAARTKTQLFMVVSAAAWLVGTLLAFRINTLQANTGNGLEFEYIIAAVVGGTMLTGGYGSTIGAAIGAVIMAMSVQGIPSANWNSDWRFVFLGAILLLAVIANNYIKNKAENLR